MPSKLANIGYYSFGANNIANVTVPSTVTSIGDNAFTENNLSSITIPSEVTTIGVNAFGDNNFTSNGCDAVYQGVTIQGGTSRFTNQSLYDAELIPCLN